MSENARDVRGIGVSIQYGMHTATYKDYMGLALRHPEDNGDWKTIIDLNIDFVCESSAGVKKMVHPESWCLTL